jgi:hypothetical protein
MIGITLTFGGTVAGLALGQFGQANASGAVALSVQEKAVLTQVALVYTKSDQPRGCPVYRGSAEGTVLNMTLFDYGAVPFRPVEVVLNGTVYGSGFHAVQPNSMAWLWVGGSGGACMHASGQNVTIADAEGGEVQFVT